MKPEYFIWLQRAPKEATQRKRKKEKKTERKERLQNKPVCLKKKASPLHLIAAFTLFMHGFCGTGPIIQSSATPINRSWPLEPEVPPCRCCLSFGGGGLQNSCTCSSNIPKVHLDVESQYKFEWLSGLGSLCVGQTAPKANLVRLFWLTHSDV